MRLSYMRLSYMRLRMRLTGVTLLQTCVVGCVGVQLATWNAGYVTGGVIMMISLVAMLYLVSKVSRYSRFTSIASTLQPHLLSFRPS
jgi:hypothetical protein